MSYLALYRKFRPLTFQEVIGQDHICKTLQNQIKNNRIGHAYLFCGSRGTGKTTLAKIFARAVNCENNVDGSPCKVCDTCKALEKADNMDVIEIDAASNNGVDDLRDLRDKVQFQPVMARYKVYIIDEVHMLSISAFNALLKTLEEPPKHVIFVLATTEPQKIPATILSRCMRFDFKLISTKEIGNHIRQLYEKVGKKAEESAIMEIAKAGNGSMRDALSVADVCLSISDGTLTFEEVSEVVGNISKDRLFDIFKAILSNQGGEVLSLLDNFLKNGKSVSQIAKDLYQFARDILVAKISDKTTLNYPSEILEKIEILAGMATSSKLVVCLERLSELDAKFRLSQNPRIVLETTLLKLTGDENDISITALLKRVVELEKKIQGGTVVANEVAVAYGVKAEENKIVDYNENFKAERTVENTNVQENPCNEYSNETLKNVKGSVLTKFRVNFNPSMFSAINLCDVSAFNDNLLVVAKSKSNEEYLRKLDSFEALQNVAKELGYVNVIIKLDCDDGSKTKGIIDNAKKLVGDMLQIK